MLVSLKILSKKVSIEKGGKKKSFIRYFSPVKIVVKGHEDEGKVSKSLTVKFTEETSKLIGDNRFFVLTVDTEKDQLSCPRVYEVKETEDKDGNKVSEYPVIWIRGFEGLKPLPQKPITEDLEFETENTETEEQEIKNDNLPF